VKEKEKEKVEIRPRKERTKHWKQEEKLTLKNLLRCLAWPRCNEDIVEFVICKKEFFIADEIRLLKMRETAWGVEKGGHCNVIIVIIIAPIGSEVRSLYNIKRRQRFFFIA